MAGVRHGATLPWHYLLLALQRRGTGPSRLACPFCTGHARVPGTPHACIPGTAALQTPTRLAASAASAASCGRARTTRRATR
eukprot:364512-Chlamydomonas_euryale.AAC.12